MADPIYQRANIFSAQQESKAEEVYQQTKAKFAGAMSETFQKYSDYYSGKVGTAIGLEEGMEATKTVTDENGQQIKVPEFKSSPFAGLTAYGDSYNKASQVAYETRVEADFLSTSNQLAQKFPADLDAFDKSTQSFEKAYFKGMRGQELAIAKSTWEQYKTRARGKVQTAQQNMAMQQNLMDIYAGRDAQVKGAIDLAGAGDLDGALAALDTAMSINKELVQLGENPKTVLADIERAYRDIEENFILGGAEALIQQNEYGQALELAKTHEYQYLDKKQQSQLLSGIRSRINSAEWDDNVAKLELTAEQEKVRAKAVGDLKIRNNRGQASYEEIDRAFEDEWITSSERVQMYAKKDSLLEASKEGADQARIVADALSGKGRLTPGNTDDEKAANAWFVDWSQDKDILGENMPDVAGAVDLIGLAPKNLQERVRNAMRSTDPAEAVQAAQLVSMIADIDPQLLDTFKDKDLAVAELMRQAVNSGTPPEQAYALAMSEAYPKDPTVLDAKKDLYKSDYKDETVSDLKDRMDEFDNSVWFGGEPEAPLELTAQYGRKVERYFVSTGNIDTARTLAWRDLKRVWGVSEVNGTRQLMEYAPEADRPDLAKAGDGQWIANQFNKEWGDEYILKADETTAREPQGRRSWLVQRVDADGIPTDVPGDIPGTVKRWRPSLEDMEEYKAFQKYKEEGMKKLRGRNG